MTDLVKWLRGWPAEVKEFGQCADEIERLREEVKEHDGVVAVWRRRCTEAEAEIERLRGLLRENLEAENFDPADWVKRVREALGRVPERD